MNFSKSPPKGILMQPTKKAIKLEEVWATTKTEEDIGKMQEKMRSSQFNPLIPKTPLLA